MNKVILKPSFWKIAALWLSVGFAILILMIVLDPSKFTDLQLLALEIAFVVVRCLIMAVIFYLIPYFQIEVNDTHVIGPGPALGGWYHVKIPLTDFESGKVKSTIPWLGFYRIDSDGFGKITVWWFDRKQFQRLLAAITARKSAEVSPALGSR